MNYWILFITFLSVNLDFFFMLLFMTKKYKLSKIIIGYVLGNIILLTASFAVGKVLSQFLPEWILGILGVLPIYMAIKNDDDDDNKKEHHSEILTVLITYLSVCAGCNLSIFLPVLVGENITTFISTVIFIGILSAIIVIVIKQFGKVPSISKLIGKHGEILMKICYVIIGLYVFGDSGLIEHIFSLF